MGLVCSLTLNMELLVENQGLNHLAIDIFIYLDDKTLAKCCSVRKSWKALIEERNHQWKRKLRQVQNEMIKRFPEMDKLFEYFYSKSSNLETQAFIDFMIRYEHCKSKFMPLMYAVDSSDIKGLKLLQISGIVEMNSKSFFSDQFSMTILHYVAGHGHPKVVDFYLKNDHKMKTNVNAKDLRGFTPFHMACLNPNVTVGTVIKTFLEHHQKINFDETDVVGLTPFLALCFYSSGNAASKTVLQCLIDNAEKLSIDINARTPRGRTGMHIASANGNYNFVKYFLQLGFNVAATMENGQTPFHRACARGQSEVVQLFLDNAKRLGIDLNQTDKDGLTGFDLACKENKREVIRLLIQNSDEFGLKLFHRNHHGRSILHRVCHNGKINTLKELLRANVDVNDQDNFGWTPLHFACNNRQREVIHLLLTAEPNVNLDLADNNGEKPIDIARNNNFNEIDSVAILLLKGKLRYAV